MLKKPYLKTISSKMINYTHPQYSSEAFKSQEKLPALNGKQNTFFGYNRSAVTSFHDKDYLDPGNMPIQQKISKLLERNQITAHVSDITMITSARYFNYVFNPVSFYYCFSENRELAAIVAEVNNTYEEHHPYVLKHNMSESDKWFAEFQMPKVFHVSPFNKVEGTYHFNFSDPGDHIEIKITTPLLRIKFRRILSRIFDLDHSRTD